MSGCHNPYYVMGNIAYSYPLGGMSCACPCHSMWNSIYPPQCYCHCHKQSACTPSVIYIETPLMKEKIKELEERLSVVEKWKKSVKILVDQSKKPHKCPVCEGSGCMSCEGKGIVWG